MITQKNPDLARIADALEEQVRLTRILLNWQIYQLASHLPKEKQKEVRDALTAKLTQELP